MKTQYLKSCSSSGLHHIAISEYGDPAHNDVLICAHGLSRNRHDFDELAQHLSSHRRVITFDFPGRGESDWLLNKKDYDQTQYIVDALMIIAYSGARQVDWLGTSMGGLLGMILSSLPKSPIQRLIVNDVGPFIPKQALDDIGNYVGHLPLVDTEAEIEQYMRNTYAGFGDLTDQQWKNMVKYGSKQTDSGQFTLSYDPGIAEVFKEKAVADIDLWPLWSNIHQPTLVLRGADSPLFLAEIAEQMKASRSDSVELITIPNTGHAPALKNEKDIVRVENWLNQTK